MVHKPGFLLSDRNLPARIAGQYKLKDEDWENRIMVWWSDHRNLSHENAMFEYLKVAQDLEMYGVSVSFFSKIFFIFSTLKFVTKKELSFIWGLMLLD